MCVFPLTSFLLFITVVLYSNKTIVDRSFVNCTTNYDRVVSGPKSESEMDNTT